MRCLNRQRTNIVFSNMLQHGSVLSPTEVSQRERIFERDGVLRWADDRILGHCQIGVSLGTLLGRVGKRHKRTGSLDLHSVKLSELISVFAPEAYMLWFDDSDDEATIMLKEGCTPVDQHKAWAHALLLAQRLRIGVPKDERGKDDTSSTEGGLAEMIRTLGEVNEHFAEYTAMLELKGWDLNVAAMETRAGSRAQITAPIKH
jgi:hypothetical protein